ncbi:hypothetical protein RvY_03914 [Ramazzottius varieornatus]|uniref:Uncharacterized protein n=1 Tax=Ramazzottius varieornatus TaxID=947166 RepID=A0A1D1UPQ2_RAMVA|nr:hypothetical protein RvY_03914 [Ramazzottius varieornatus]
MRANILSQCNVILKSDLVDERDVLAFIGTQAETLKDEEKPLLDLRKTARIEALYQKCLVLLHSDSPESSSREEVAETVKQLQRLVDGKTDARLAEVLSHLYTKRGQLGRAFKYAWQHMDLDKKTTTGYGRLCKLAEDLSWPHVAQHFRDQIPVLFPNIYELF